VIGKQDILDRAAEWRLRPDMVEKDYVLGWLLTAIGTHPGTSTSWVFKGGTCLKKCYVETYRFSEDLDFTLRPNAVYDEVGLREILRGIAAEAQNASGITFFPDDLILRARQNRRGQQTWEARFGYRGPLATPGQPKVRFDLTEHEEIVLASERRGIFHPYPDDLPPGAGVACYALDEVVAEKTRALVDRTRPRDLYDVVLILENHAPDLNLPQVREVFVRKCRAKNISVLSSAELIRLVRSSDELKAEWGNMLAHQLPALPEVAVLLERLPTALHWLDAAPAAAPAPPRARLASASAGAGATPPLEAPRSSRYWGLGQPIETIRFAGANRLMVSFTYHGTPRIVEPYSLRRPDTDNLLLYGWEVASSHIKAFKVLEMSGVQVTHHSFRPRYRVEFAA